MTYTQQITVNIRKLSAVKSLNDQILSGKRAGCSDFCVHIAGEQTYANICAPIAGVLAYYRSQGLNIQVIYDPPQSYARQTRFDAPAEAEDLIEHSSMSNPFDKVWRFRTSEEINALVNAFILSVRQADIIKPGVISSLEWCLNETMDNVLQHSQAECGYLMGQLHKNHSRLSMCIFDSGIGIYNSLKGSRHSPPAPLDAITLALQEKVTRDEKVGQGNGLWGLSRLISDSHGTIRISSGGAVYCKNQDGEISTVKDGEFNLGRENGTTLVDFQMDYSQEIDITRILNGYQPVDLWLENIEADNGDAVISIATQSHGTGTRRAAEKMRTMALNLTLSDKKRVVFDFSGVNLISSSYSDELVGKIISRYGFSFFINHFAIINLSPTNASILNRSVQQRMAQAYYDETMNETDEDEQ